MSVIRGHLLNHQKTAIRLLNSIPNMHRMNLIMKTNRYMEVYWQYYDGEIFEHDYGV